MNSIPPPRSASEKNLFAFLALFAYTLLACGMTLPLVLKLGDHLLGTDSNALNDTYFSVWIFGWQAHQLIADPLNFFQGNIFYPFPNTLAFSEVILPGALLYLPFAYATGNPVLSYNLVVLLTFPLNGLAMYLFTWDWWPTTDDGDASSRLSRRTATVRDTRYAAFLAGLIFAFCTYKMGELRHVQLLMAMFMPLALMYVARLLRVPNFHNAFFTALFFALNALSSLYYAVFLVLAIVLYVVIDFLLRRFPLTRQHLLYGFISFVIAALILLPLLLPFFQLERQYNFSEGRDPSLFSARPVSYLATPASQWLYGNLTRAFYVASKGQPLFPGVIALGLALIGVITLLYQKNRAWIFPVFLALMAFLLSFGPILTLGRSSESVLPFHLPYYFLSFVLTPLKSLNAPARFAVLVMLALSLLAASGAYALLRRSPRGGLTLVAMCAILLLAEYIPAPLRLIPVDTGAHISPAYLFLAQQPRAPVVEMPMGKPAFADQDKHVVYTYNSLYHWQPLINGYSTFIPPDYYGLVKDVQNFPSNDALARLKAWGAVWIVVHSDAYKNPTRLRARLDALTGIEHVQDFDEIWLYRIRH